MLRILIAEDDPTVASTLQHLIEENPLYSVVGVAEDAQAAIELASIAAPDIALLDLQLARGSTGFAAASQLGELGIMCLFVSGKAPDIAMTDLAIGCLAKPFTADDLHVALSIAEDMLRGRPPKRSRLPANLTLYGGSEPTDELGDSIKTESEIRPTRPSFKTRLIYWLNALGSD